MKTPKVILAGVFTAVLTTSLALAATDTFKATLMGKEEVPAVTTAAEGSAVFELSADGEALAYVLTVKDIENATAAHIHAGKMGENGGVLVGLFSGPKKDGKFSGELAKGTITADKLAGPLAGKTVADLVTMLKSGGAYVNVHTTKNPPGEIRGQIR